MATIEERVAQRYLAAESPAFWKQRAEMHEREIQSIKHRLKERHGGVFDEYLADSTFAKGAEEANKLRKALELHRIALAAAQEQRNPTHQEIADGLRHLGPAVQKARV